MPIKPQACWNRRPRETGRLLGDEVVFDLSLAGENGGKISSRRIHVVDAVFRGNETLDTCFDCGVDELSLNLNLGEADG